jgi:hypothetical protein
MFVFPTSVRPVEMLAGKCEPNFSFVPTQSGHSVAEAIMTYFDRRG